MHLMFPLIKVLSWQYDCWKSVLDTFTTDAVLEKLDETCIFVAVLFTISALMCLEDVSTLDSVECGL